jgi:hypothetical protein
LRIMACVSVEVGLISEFCYWHIILTMHWTFSYLMANKYSFSNLFYVPMIYECRLNVHSSTSNFGYSWQIRTVVLICGIFDGLKCILILVLFYFTADSMVRLYFIH